jgi:hypothetical protein
MAVGTLSAARAGIQEAASQLATSSRNISRMLPQAMPPVSLERELVHQMVALVQGKASIRVANTELELLGTLLDLKA